MPNLVFLFILAFCLVFLCSGVLVGRLRPKGDAGSNVLQTSRFLFPRYSDEPPCKTDLGQLGLCVDVRFCYAARRAVSAGNHPVRCGWIDNFIPMVCCHPDQVQQPKPMFRPFFWHYR